MTNYNGGEWYTSDILAEWTGLAAYERQVLSDSPKIGKDGSVAPFEGYKGGFPEFVDTATDYTKGFLILGALVAGAYIYNSFK